MISLKFRLIFLFLSAELIVNAQTFEDRIVYQNSYTSKLAQVKGCTVQRDDGNHTRVFDQRRKL
jgi:hypothetical protein